MGQLRQPKKKRIKRMVEKMVETHKDWHEKLSLAPHAYPTSVQASTNATPVSFVYRMKVVLPIKVEIPSLWVLMETKLGKAEWVKNRYDQLNLIKEKCIGHCQMHQRRMIRVHNKKDAPTMILSEPLTGKDHMLWSKSSSKGLQSC